MTEAKHSQLTIHDALRDSLCPRPANGEPDDQTAGSCFDKGQCGCRNGEALTADASLHAELVAALEESHRFMEYFAGETGGRFVGPGTPKSCLQQIDSVLQKAKQP